MLTTGNKSVDLGKALCNLESLSLLVDRTFLNRWPNFEEFSSTVLIKTSNIKYELTLHSHIVTLLY
jgi:hypothetical protein